MAQLLQALSKQTLHFKLAIEYINVYFMRDVYFLCILPYVFLHSFGG